MSWVKASPYTYRAALPASAALVLAACTVAASPSPGGEAPSPATQRPTVTPQAETVSIRYTFDWKPDGDWAPGLWGQELDYFAEEGLEVELFIGDGSSAALPLLGQGEMDIGQISAPPLILSVSEDLPVTAVGVQMTETQLVVLADADKGITEVQDIEGHTVAVQRGEFEGAVWDAFVDVTGIDVSTIEEVPAAGTADALFIDHMVDVAIDHYTSGAMIALTEEREGEETLFLLRDYLDVAGHTTVVNNTFLEQHAEALRGFMRAWARGMKYTIDDPDATVDLILGEFPENDRAATEWSVSRYVDYWSQEQAQTGGLLSFTPELWESTKEVLVGGGLMEEADISHLYSDDYLPDPPVMP